MSSNTKVLQLSLSSPKQVVALGTKNSELLSCVKPCQDNFKQLEEVSGHPNEGTIITKPTKYRNLKVRQIEEDETHIFIVSTSGKFFVKRIASSKFAEVWDDNADNAMNFTEISPVLNFSVSINTRGNNLHLVLENGLVLECLKPCFDTEFLVIDYYESAPVFSVSNLASDEDEVHALLNVNGKILKRSVTKDIQSLIEQQNNLKGKFNQVLHNLNMVNQTIKAKVMAFSHFNRTYIAAQGVVDQALAEIAAKNSKSVQSWSTVPVNPRDFRYGRNEDLEKYNATKKAQATEPKDGFSFLTSSTNPQIKKKISELYTINEAKRQCELWYYREEINSIHRSASDYLIEKIFSTYCENIHQNCRWNFEESTCEQIIPKKESRLPPELYFMDDVSCSKTYSVNPALEEAEVIETVVGKESTDNGEEIITHDFEDPECFDHQVRKKLPYYRPPCWDYNSTVNSTASCYEIIAPEPITGYEREVIHDFRAHEILTKLRFERHSFCFQVGFTSTARIMDCGGAFRHDPYCGTFLELHFKGDNRTISRSRLPFHSSLTNGYR
eukprot:snap_masked-scaffold_2-processed-gene-14.19-mRNA-1 protein AED:1.00 eAED:1.00 QI:0/0/0/0/1/1/4/0/554